MTSAREMLDDLLAHRILILDGAMGTLIQQRDLTEADYRGDRFRLHSRNLRGDHDILCLTRPDLVSGLHRAYLEAGADIIKTNTFSSTAVVQADYGLETLAYELNSAAAQLAKALACEWTARTPDKPRFVAGSIGPTTRRLSLPDNVRRSTSPVLTMDDVRQAYKAQVRGLVDGGCDILLVETIVDPLNAQAAVEAIEAVQKGRPDELPLMLSVTLERGGLRTLAEQTLDAFSDSMAHARPFIVGINCSFGAGRMHAALADLARASNSWVSCHPNAGLPDASGRYVETPAETATLLREFADAGLLNIAGGCCGTTPEHIRAIAEALRDVPPRRLPEQRWN
jgi:5-methyltetrahydrofolate--homocysteine methyltransferase